MKNKKFLGLITLLIFLTFSSFISNGNSVSNINYTFNRNILLDTDTTSFNQEFNLRDVSFQQGRYNATYGFLNESNGQNPQEWILDESGGSIEVITDFVDDHRSVLELLDDDTSNPINMYNEFNDGSQTSGIVEFWFFSIDANKGMVFTLREGAGRRIHFRLGGNIISYFYSGSFHNATNGNINNNVWYHIRIVFDCTPDTYDFYLNTTLIDSNIPFRSVATDINRIYMETFTPETSLAYIDAVGYSWNSFYSTYFNLMPIIETVDYLKEVDKAEFALKAPNTFTTSADTNYDGFEVVEASDGIVFSLPDPLDSNDRVIALTVQDAGDVAQIKMDDLGLTGGTWIQTKVEVSVQEFDGLGGAKFTTFIYSFDDTNVGGFGFDQTGTHTFNIDIRVAGWSTIAYGMNAFDNILIDHYVNYELDIQMLDLYINNTFQNRSIRPLIVSGKSGLNKIEVDLAQSAFAGSVNVDSVGVYINYVSITKGLGWSVISIGQEWNLRTHNLFTKSIGMSNGLLHLATAEGYYQVEHFPNTFAELAPFQAYESNPPLYDVNTPTFENVYDKIVEPTGHIIENSSFIFTINGSLFSVSEFLIEGVKLTERNNNYNLVFRHENVSINDNYFYVDSNNRLNFIHTTNDNDTFEFIQASFNINDFSTNNFSLSFFSQIQNRAKGTFTVDYSSSSDVFNLSIPLTKQNPSLTQEKTAQSFIFLITDNNNNNLSGITNGFISNIIIIPFTNILDTGLIFSLFIMLIPLIVILIPTIALRELYGSNFVMPIFLLMSFILLLGGILPIWLMFVIMVSTSLFIIKEKDRRGIFE